MRFVPVDELDRQGYGDYHHLFDDPEEAAR
jgi:hypothetical protein